MLTGLLEYFTLAFAVLNGMVLQNIIVSLHCFVTSEGIVGVSLRRRTVVRLLTAGWCSFMSHNWYAPVSIKILDCVP